MDTSNGQASDFDAGFVADWSRRWLAAWNAHDVEGIVALCTDDVRCNEPALPRPLHGREGMRSFAGATFTAFPDVRIEELEPPYVSEAAGKALSPYRFVATMTGPWEHADIAPTGAAVDFVGIDEWVFRGELLSRYDTHYDSLDVARQLGLLPAVGSRPDRLLSRFQHVGAGIQRRWLRGERCTDARWERPRGSRAIGEGL